MSKLQQIGLDGHTWTGDYLTGGEQQVTVSYSASTSQYSPVFSWSGPFLVPSCFYLCGWSGLCTLICWHWSWRYSTVSSNSWNGRLIIQLQRDISTIEGWVSSNIYPWILLNKNSWLYLGKWTHPPQPDYPESCMFQYLGLLLSSNLAYYINVH